MWAIRLCAAVLLAAGCEEAPVEMLSSGLSVRYLSGCAPAAVDRLSIEALGDFPSSPRNFVALDSADGEQTLGGLPESARMFRLSVVTSDYDGVAIAPSADDGTRFSALVLPTGVHCTLLSEGMPPLGGSATALIEAGDLLIAGGLAEDGETARRDGFVLEVAEPALARTGEGLYLARAGAAAVRTRVETLVIGGAPSLRAGTPAHDSFERFDPQTRRFARIGRLRSPRVGATAVRLLDGSVLVAGGQSAVQGAALDSLEHIAEGAEDSTLYASALPAGLVDVRLSVRDDGLVVVTGRAEQRAVLALFDPGADAIEELEAPSFDPSLAVALPGGRVALFETEAGTPPEVRPRTTGRMWILLSDGTFALLDRWLTPFAGISGPRTLALSNGRVLLAGDASGGATSRVIDPGRGEVRVRELDLAPEWLFLRDDGSALELAPGSAQIVREDARTIYDNPGGTLLADDSEVVSFDAPEHWLREGLALVAAATGARFDLAGLSYLDARIVLSVQGASELVLQREDGAERVIEVGGARVGPTLCKLDADPADELAIERRGASVRIASGRATRSCTLDGLQGRIAIGLRALEPRVMVQALSVTRL